MAQRMAPSMAARACGLFFQQDAPVSSEPCWTIVKTSRVARSARVVMPICSRRATTVGPTPFTPRSIARSDEEKDIVVSWRKGTGSRRSPPTRSIRYLKMDVLPCMNALTLLSFLAMWRPAMSRSRLALNVSSALGGTSALRSPSGSRAFVSSIYGEVRPTQHRHNRGRAIHASSCSPSRRAL